MKAIGHLEDSKTAMLLSTKAEVHLSPFRMGCYARQLSFLKYLESGHFLEWLSFSFPSFRSSAKFRASAAEIK